MLSGRRGRGRWTGTRGRCNDVAEMLGMSLTGWSQVLVWTPSRPRPRDLGPGPFDPGAA